MSGIAVAGATVVLSVICSVRSFPSRDFTASTVPSNAVMVPRTRTLVCASAAILVNRSTQKNTVGRSTCMSVPPEGNHQYDMYGSLNLTGRSIACFLGPLQQAYWQKRAEGYGMLEERTIRV